MSKCQLYFYHNLQGKRLHSASFGGLLVILLDDQRSSVTQLQTQVTLVR